MKKFLLAPLLLLACAFAHSEVRVGYINTHHLKEPSKIDKWNEQHFSIAWRSEDSGLSVMGLSKNSYGDPTALAGWVFDFKPIWKIKPEIFLGGAYGYKDYLKNYHGVAAYGWLGLDFDTEFNDFYIHYRGVRNIHTIAVEYKF